MHSGPRFDWRGGVAAVRNPFRRRPTPTPPPRANPTRIAVLEHDLFGIRPEPGAGAALTLGPRTVGTCFRHLPVAAVGPDGVSDGQCASCGRAMVLDDTGTWVIASA